jgi:chorismate dehydratase
MGRDPSLGLILGKIGFVNVLPIYYPLEAGIVPHQFTVISGTPAQLNEMAAKGELDVSAVSSVEYARHPERYLLVPDLSISSRGPVGSVLLLSRIPIEELGGRPVLTSAKSHSSALLLRVLFSLRLGITPDFRTGHPGEALVHGNAPLAMLLIGDEALRYRHHPEYPHRWDLGEVWYAWTGLPFVFGVWVIQRTALEFPADMLPKAVDSLLKAKAWGCANLDEICRQAMPYDLMNYDELYQYYQGLGFHLSEIEEKGLRSFFRCLTEIGELPHDPPVEFYSPMARVA